MPFAMPMPLRFQTVEHVKDHLDHARNTMPTTTARISEIRMATSSVWHAMSLKSDAPTSPRDCFATRQLVSQLHDPSGWS